MPAGVLGAVSAGAPWGWGGAAAAKMVDATCMHAQEYIALTVKENGSTVGTEYAFSKSKPSVNVHLSDSGTY